MKLISYSLSKESYTTFFIPPLKKKFEQDSTALITDLYFELFVCIYGSKYSHSNNVQRELDDNFPEASEKWRCQSLPI